MTTATARFLKPLAAFGFLTAVLVLPGGNASADGPFTPTFAETIDDTAPDDPFTLPADDDCRVGSPCKHMFQLSIPDGQPGPTTFPGVDARELAPSAISFAGDSDVPDCAIVAGVSSSGRVGPIGNCSTGVIEAPGAGYFFDATIDPGSTTGLPGDLSSCTNWPTQLDGVRDEVLNDNPGAALHARWQAGETNVLVFQLSGGSTLGMTIHGDPAAPPVQQNCGPINTTVLSLGVSMDNPDTGPDEGGYPLISCTTAGTHTYQLFVDRNDTPPGDAVTLTDTATCSSPPPGPPVVGGVTGLTVDTELPGTSSGSPASSDYTLRLAAVATGVILALATTAWYARRRWPG